MYMHNSCHNKLFTDSSIGMNLAATCISYSMESYQREECRLLVQDVEATESYNNIYKCT